MECEEFLKNFPFSWLEIKLKNMTSKELRFYGKMQFQSLDKISFCCYVRAIYCEDELSSRHYKKS